MESPDSWAWRFLNEEMTDTIAAGLAQSDAILLGRRTYLAFAEMWRSQGSDVPMADFLNNTPKYVASRTLHTLEWGSATVLSGDLADTITELKHQPGKNIQVPGSPTLVRWLLRNGLLNELALMVCPVVVGAGMRLFDDITEALDFKLVTSKPLSTGAVALTYQPATATSEWSSFPDAAARRA